MDTTTFVFGPKEPRMAGSRWFKNVPLSWKILAAVMLAVLFAFAMTRFSVGLAVPDFTREMDDCVRSLDRLSLGADLAVLSARLERGSSELAVLARSLAARMSGAGLRNPASLVADTAALAGCPVDFVAVLDARGRMSSVVSLQRRGGGIFGTEIPLSGASGRTLPLAGFGIDGSVSPGVSSVQAGRSSSPYGQVGAAGGADLDGGCLFAGVTLLSPDVLLAMGLAERASVVVEGAGDVTVEDGLVLAAVCRIGGTGPSGAGADRAERSVQAGRGGRAPAFVLAGLLLNNDVSLLDEVERTIGAVCERTDVPFRVSEPRLSVILGRTRVATTLRDRAGERMTGSIVAGPASTAGDIAACRPVFSEEICGDGKYLFGRLDLRDAGGARIGAIEVAHETSARLGLVEDLAGRLSSMLDGRLWDAFILALAAALLIGLLAARIVIWPIILLSGTTREVARGRLDVELELDGSDEIGELAACFRTMLSNLRALTRRLDQATSRIAEAADDLGTTLGRQAATTAQQSVAVHETTATLEELAASSRGIADNALSVVKVAAKTLESAQRGVASSRDTIGHMAEIIRRNDEDLKRIAELSALVARIDEIMTLINNIADRTKLIAFNAAIEAAAAGEAGDRFSIVSEEIRRLAENVQDRAAEIRASIGNVQKAAEDLVASRRDGTRVVQAGGEATRKTRTDLEEILEDTRSVLDDSKQISLSTQQQRLATEQTLRAVKEINQGVNELAEGSRSTEEVAMRLRELARSMREDVQGFKRKADRVDGNYTAGLAGDTPDRHCDPAGASGDMGTGDGDPAEDRDTSLAVSPGEGGRCE